MAQAAERYMQGIAVPESAVRPSEFFARTRRKLGTEVSKTFAGLAQQDVVEIKKTDILSEVTVRFVGQLTVTPGSGSVATTRRWPYDLLRQVRFTANGQSNLINCSGAKLKVREFMHHHDLNDRGVQQSIAGSTIQQGTLSQSHESWGVGSGATAIAGGTYDVDLEWVLPIAEDQVDLMGAIFCATSSTDLSLVLDWATPAELFALAGNGAAGLAGKVQVIAKRFSIPISDGNIVVPDLSQFHSLIQTRYTNLSLGVNELRMTGQGAGKTLLRLFTQVWNGAGAGAPLAVTDANYGRLGWRYSGNETPDELESGIILRALNERYYNTDIGKAHGFFCHEFAQENAFRDTVDLGTTSEFRQLVELASGLTLTNAAAEYVAESIFVAGA
ncbi:hypothetical protein JOE61_003853 [Nocardioides salarius]|uniref:P3 N-terminal domain-containing protein n=1 Tax=Nocardioides salarius TaxID=374513 RepID=A0ABS2MFR8_9ACTN|nr:hypothetical protein [Nocardioides salarius]MBM7510039.1 hypothetical protein [Nocardioides salarius]